MASGRGGGGGRKPPPPRTEAALQRRVVREIKRLRPEAWVWHPVGSPYQTPGIPDLLVCIDGLFVGLELKLPGPRESVEHARNRATPQQRHQIGLINASGGVAGVVTSVEEAMDLLHRAKVKQAERSKQSDPTPTTEE